MATFKRKHFPIPRSLIHPILTGRQGAGGPISFRSAAELAAINDHGSVPRNAAELAEAYRIAGMTPDGLEVDSFGKTSGL